MIWTYRCDNGEDVVSLQCLHHVYFGAGANDTSQYRYDGEQQGQNLDERGLVRVRDDLLRMAHDCEAAGEFHDDEGDKFKVQYFCETIQEFVEKTDCCSARQREDLRARRRVLHLGARQFDRNAACTRAMKPLAFPLSGVLRATVPLSQCARSRRI